MARSTSNQKSSLNLVDTTPFQLEVLELSTASGTYDFETTNNICLTVTTTVSSTGNRVNLPSIAQDGQIFICNNRNFEDITIGLAPGSGTTINLPDETRMFFVKTPGTNEWTYSTEALLAIAGI